MNLKGSFQTKKFWDSIFLLDSFFTFLYMHNIMKYRFYFMVNCFEEHL